MADLISSTVERWDAADTSRRIELQVGRDLQFIRINGTVVGGLAGLAIHTRQPADHVRFRPHSLARNCADGGRTPVQSTLS